MEIDDQTNKHLLVVQTTTNVFESIRNIHQFILIHSLFFNNNNNSTRRINSNKPMILKIYN